VLQYRIIYDKFHTCSMWAKPWVSCGESSSAKEAQYGIWCGTSAACC